MARMLLPIAGIFVIVLVITGAVTAYFLLQGKSEEKDTAAREIIVRLTMINNEIQRERGFVTAYGHSDMQQEGVVREIEATDEYCILLLPQIEVMMDSDGVLQHQSDTLAAIAPALEHLAEIRANAGNDTVSPLETFAAYTGVVDIISQAAAELHGELAISRNQQTFEIQLLALIEHLSRERGYGMIAQTGAIPAQELARARQINLSGLERLQSDIRRTHFAEASHSAMLTPFLTDVSHLHRLEEGTDIAQIEEAPDDVEVWFNTMTGHIDTVRLLHTRLLVRASGAAIPQP